MRKTTSTIAGWAPFICVVVAILLVGSAAVSWVLSPSWGIYNAQAQARNAGVVPTVAGAQVNEVRDPNRIRIPKLGADAPIYPLSLGTGDAFAPPINPRDTGWWNGGAKPGAATGTALIAGHINYAGVAGVLGQIGTLNPGDTIYVDGLTANKKAEIKFRVTGIRTYSKQALPYKDIFSQSSVGRLAVVTCGGPFDAHTGNYLDNIVVFAVPA